MPHLLLALLPLTAVHADLLPEHARPAMERLVANGDTFDRVDQFCKGKRPRDACVIEGSRLAGGGPGFCQNAIHPSGEFIDLTCERNSQVQIDRGLPRAGFVASDSLCGGGPDKLPSPVGCTPLVPMPVDRFCRDKAVGDVCVVTLSYAGESEHNDGVCRVVTQTHSFYFKGRQVATREVLQCDAEAPVERRMSELSWWEKRRQ